MGLRWASARLSRQVPPGPVQRPSQPRQGPSLLPPRPPTAVGARRPSLSAFPPQLPVLVQVALPQGKCWIRILVGVPLPHLSWSGDLKTQVNPRVGESPLYLK